MRYIVFGLFPFFLQIIIFGKDWPTYGGLEKNHCTDEKSLRLDWGIDEPNILWRHNVGLGYSSVVEVAGLAYTQGYEKNQNTLFCVDAKSGKIK